MLTLLLLVDYHEDVVRAVVVVAVDYHHVFDVDSWIL